MEGGVNAASGCWLDLPGSVANEHHPVGDHGRRLPQRDRPAGPRPNAGGPKAVREAGTETLQAFDWLHAVGASRSDARGAVAQWDRPAEPAGSGMVVEK